MTCAWCGAEVHAGTYLCTACVKTLDKALGNVPAYYHDLDTLRQKRARYGGTASKGGIGKAQPLPIDGRFTDATGPGSQLAYDARATIIAWTRVVLDQWAPIEDHQPCTGDCLHVICAEVRRRRHPRDTVESCCSYLGGMRSLIATQPWAAELIDEILNLEDRLNRMVDRPADKQFIGQCSADPDDPNGPCGADLYANVDAQTATCEACGAEHEVAGRRDSLLQTAREYAVTATEAAGALCAWTDYDGSPVKLVDLIRKWAEPTKTRPARLASVGTIEHLGRDRALYRLGDIEVLVRGHVQERGLKSTA